MLNGQCFFIFKELCLKQNNNNCGIVPNISNKNKVILNNKISLFTTQNYVPILNFCRLSKSGQFMLTRYEFLH